MNTSQYVIPFIEAKLSTNKGSQVLEIGCGEGGVLKAFLDKDFIGTGVEISENMFNLAKVFLKQEIENQTVTLIKKDIYDVNLEKIFTSKFDLIVLKDVIEHIHDQGKLMAILKKFLKPNGYIYIAFPPWQMPFGGHQQTCRSKILSRTPFFHLLPNFVYKGVLKLFGENDNIIKGLMEAKETGISIEKFESIIHKAAYEIVTKELYLINPIYEYKFKLRPRKQLSFVAKVPYLRNYLTTCGYYLITPRKKWY
ncbi:MAG: class I SAM-dependent methyltransferase [Bacteroidota bacterium]